MQGRFLSRRRFLNNAEMERFLSTYLLCKNINLTMKQSLLARLCNNLPVCLLMLTNRDILDVNYFGRSLHPLHCIGRDILQINEMLL